jgi:hypothetical protein
MLIAVSCVKKNKSSSISIALVIPLVLAISLLYIVTSFSTATSNEVITAHIQDVKHNSSHNSDLKGAMGSATIELKTDIFSDSDCGTYPIKKNCPNNSDMVFSAQVSDNSGRNLYGKIIYGSPDLVTLPVTTSIDSTKSNPDKFTLKLHEDSYKIYCCVKPYIGYWFPNPSVSKVSCLDENIRISDDGSFQYKIWNGAKIQCHLVIHYAWSG